MNGKGSLLVAVAFAVAMLGSVAQARSTFVWNPPCNSDGLWSTVENWIENSSMATRYPGYMATADNVFIPEHPNGQPTLDVSVEVALLTLDSPSLAPEMLTIDDATLVIGAADGLTVLLDAVLRIQGSDGELVLPTTTSAGHFIEGEIWLENATAEIVVDAEVVLIGSGMIASTTGRITILSDAVLTIDDVTIEGADLLVQGSGEFHNAGLVRAVGGDILFGAGVTLCDTGDNNPTAMNPLWQVDNNCVMQFNKPFTGLSGDFRAIGNGAFEFTTAACHVTTGGLYVGVTQQNECPDPENPPLDITSGGGFRFKDISGENQHCGDCP